VLKIAGRYSFVGTPLSAEKYGLRPLRLETADARSRAQTQQASELALRLGRKDSSRYCADRPHHAQADAILYYVQL
jgi:hypothetical protein